MLATVLANQTALHALPAAINGLSNALMSTLPNGTSIAVTNAPLPTLRTEQATQLGEQAGRQARTPAVPFLSVLCRQMYLHKQHLVHSVIRSCSLQYMPLATWIMTSHAHLPDRGQDHLHSGFGSRMCLPSQQVLLSVGPALLMQCACCWLAVGFLFTSTSPAVLFSPRSLH